MICGGGCWTAIIFTSPFWFILILALGYFSFVSIMAMLVGIVGLIEKFLNLFRRK